jgi:hypothetical protein
LRRSRRFEPGVLLAQNRQRQPEKRAACFRDGDATEAAVRDGLRVFHQRAAVHRLEQGNLYRRRQAREGVMAA